MSICDIVQEITDTIMFQIEILVLSNNLYILRPTIPNFTRKYRCLNLVPPFAIFAGYALRFFLYCKTNSLLFSIRFPATSSTNCIAWGQALHCRTAIAKPAEKKTTHPFDPIVATPHSRSMYANNPPANRCWTTLIVTWGARAAELLLYYSPLALSGC